MIELIQCSMCKAVLESGADEKTAERQAKADGRR